MKILVTGATGFVGTYLVKRLKKEGHDVYAVVRSSTDTEKLKREKIKIHIMNPSVTDLVSFFEKEKFDGIVHLASLFLTEHSAEQAKELVESNVVFPSMLLEAATAGDVRWFINTGTFWQHFEDAEYCPVNLYAATKEAFEDIARFYMEKFPINFVTIKLFNIFGPNDTRSKVFNLWLKIAKTKEQLDMSPGEQVIDITYIDNVIDAYIKMIGHLSKDKKLKYKGEIFSVTSKERMSLKKLANLFEKTTGVKLNINWGKKPYRPREVMMPWTKGKPVPGWKASVSLKQGIIKTFNHE